MPRNSVTFFTRHRSQPVSTTKSLYQWILASILLCVLGLALGTIVIGDYRQIKTTATQSTQTQLRLLHDILQDEFSAVVKAFDKATAQISDQIEVNNSDYIHKRLELLKIALPAMESIFVRNAAG